MDSAHLKAFIKVADCHSMSAAAKELYLTPVTLLQQMNQLENEAGFKLFIRSTRGVTLTPAGERFYSGAQRSLREMDLLLAECRHIEHTDKNTITACIYRPYSFIQYGNTYALSHPGIKFLYQSWQPISQKASVWMEEQSIDIMQNGYYSPFLQDGLSMLPICRDRLVCLCEKDHPLARKKAVTLDDLAPYCVFSFLSLSDCVDLLERSLKAHKCTLHREVYSDLKVLKCCTSGGLYLIEENMADVFDQLCSVPLEPEWPIIHCAVYRANAPAYVLDFIEYLRKCTGEEQVQQMQEVIESLSRAVQGSGGAPAR